MAWPRNEGRSHGHKPASHRQRVIQHHSALSMLLQRDSAAEGASARTGSSVSLPSRRTEKRGSWRLLHISKQSRRLLVLFCGVVVSRFVCLLTRT